MHIRTRHIAPIVAAFIFAFITILPQNMALTQPEDDPFAESLADAQSISRLHPRLLSPEVRFNCPCMVTQARANPYWWERSITGLATFHPGAADAYRSRYTWQSRRGGVRHGQQCTYDALGRLITSGAAAGTPDIVSPRVDTTDHWDVDVVPFERLGWRIYTQYWRPNNGNACRANSVTPITLTPGGGLIRRLPNAQVGAGYIQRLDTIGGRRPFGFELTGSFAPALEFDDTVMPYGLSIVNVNGTWQIAGIPTADAANETFTFTVRATAANGLTGMQVYRISVDEADEPEPPAIPNLIGTWNGTATQGPGGYANTYPFTITISTQTGNSVSGTNRIAVSGTAWYAVMSFTGMLSNNVLTLQESQILEQRTPAGAGWCIKRMQLTLSGNTLSGPWTAPGCPSGTISVSR